MSLTAPKEIQGLSNVEPKTGKIVQMVHSHGQDLVSNVTKEAQNIEPSLTEDHVAPSAPNPIPANDALEKVGAERVGIEPDLSSSKADIEHGVKTIGAMFGIEDSTTFNRGVPGGRVISLAKERIKRLVSKSAQQT